MRKQLKMKVSLTRKIHIIALRPGGALKGALIRGPVAEDARQAEAAPALGAARRAIGSVCVTSKFPILYESARFTRARRHSRAETIPPARQHREKTSHIDEQEMPVDRA